MPRNKQVDYKKRCEVLEKNNAKLIDDLYTANSQREYFKKEYEYLVKKEDELNALKVRFDSLTNELAVRKNANSVLDSEYQKLKLRYYQVCSKLNTLLEGMREPDGNCEL